MPPERPTTDTFRRVISAIDPYAFCTCFIDWVNAVVGKEVRRCWVSDDVAWVAGAAKWVGLNRIAMIEYVRLAEDPVKWSLKGKRKRAGWANAYLEKVLGI